VAFSFSFGKFTVWARYLGKMSIVEGEADPLTPAIELGKGRYSDSLLTLIDSMLAPAIKRRPQNVWQVLAQLDPKPIIDEPIIESVTAGTEINPEVRSTLVTELVSEKPDQKTSERKKHQRMRFNDILQQFAWRKLVVSGVIVVLVFSGLGLIPKILVFPPDLGTALTQVGGGVSVEDNQIVTKGWKVTENDDSFYLVSDDERYSIFSIGREPSFEKEIHQNEITPYTLLIYLNEQVTPNRVPGAYAFESSLNFNFPLNFFDSPAPNFTL